MTIGRIFFVLIVVAAIGGGLYFYKGGGGTTPAVNVNAPEADPFLAADTEFGLNNYQQAINEYRAAIEKDPDNEKVVEATYRIAVSYDKLKDRDESIKAYGDFIAKYPKDNRAQTARSREEYYRSSN